MKKIAAVVVVMLFILGVALGADTTFGVGKTRNITFSSDVKIGSTVLPAGEYRILHLMEGSEHTLVFKAVGNNTEKARVKCNMAKLDKKSDQTYSETKTINNERVLVALVFRGDDFKHSF